MGSIKGGSVVPLQVAPTEGDSPLTPRSRVNARLKERTDQHTVAREKSEAFVTRLLGPKPVGSNERILGSWMVRMVTNSNIPFERTLVLTSAALYRCQYLPEHGFVNKCKRTPLRSIARVYAEAGKHVVVQERLSRGGRLGAFKDMLFSVDMEPPSARPWRSGEHMLSTRWYTPIGMPGSEPAGAVEEMMRAITLVATWSTSCPRRESDTDSVTDNNSNSDEAESQRIPMEETPREETPRGRISARITPRSCAAEMKFTHDLMLDDLSQESFSC